MSFAFFWQIPSAGDSPYGDARRVRRGERPVPGRRGPPARFNELDYLHQVARAAELAGFDGVQVQHDPSGDASWIVAGTLARSTRRVTLLAEFPASWGSAVYAAKNAVTFQRFSGGRFAWQITPGPSEAERRRQGDFVPDGELLARIDEFLTVARGVQTTAPFSFQGKFFEVKDGGFVGPLAHNRVTPVFLSGETEEALALSGRQADVHVFVASPVATVSARVAALTRHAEAHRRQVAAALRIDVLARETEEEARRDAERFWTQSRPLLALPVPRAAGQAAAVWPDLTKAWTGAEASLVGSYERVSAGLAAYAEAGISQFLLAGVPHFEEAYRLGEHVLPGLRTRLSSRSVQAA
jgi:alkanesulfonate monooxygenase